MGDFFRRLRRFFKRAFFRHLVRDVEAAVGMVFLVYRPHQQVADQAENQKSGHDVHGDAVCLCRRHAAVDLSLPDVVHQHGAEHGGSRPGQEDATVDGADFQRAEQVFDVYRHGGKSPAVHGDDDAEADDEQRFAAAFAQRGDGEIEQSAEDEEEVVGRFAPQPVGDAGPEKAAAHVEQAQQADEAGRRRRTDRRTRADGLFGKQFLYHDRSLSQHADAGGNVQAQNPKQQVKLRRFDGL